MSKWKKTAPLIYKPLISANNVPWGMTEQDIEEWDERFEEEMERIGDMYCEDVLDDIVN